MRRKEENESTRAQVHKVYIVVLVIGSNFILPTFYLEERKARMIYCVEISELR